LPGEYSPSVLVHEKTNSLKPNLHLPITSESRSMRTLASTLVASLVLFLNSFAQAEEKATAPKDIIATAAGADQFSTLVAAIKAGELVEALQGEGPFTVFAPTNEAFAKLPSGTVESLLKPENKAKLQAILKYHVVSGKVPASKVVGLKTAKTLNGQEVKISTEDGVQINESKVVKADIMCTNGVIHVIDAVLLPK
jgi:uncharacterized surface protein with fasciclin (FAS1) repeats